MGKLFHIGLYFYYLHPWRSSVLPHSLSERLPWITIITAIHTHTVDFMALAVLQCKCFSALHYYDEMHMCQY